jgi:predicted SAM-dependent methyltransferase
VEQKEYLDVGCGPNIHEYFINLDYWWQPSIDICWDVTKGIPLRDESVKGIFTEHCLEHLPFEAVDFLLSEFWRVLKPAGSVRIVVPDGELYLTRYSEIIRGYSSDQLPYADNDNYQGLYSPIMSVNRIFRNYGHLFIYDFDIFRLLLEKNRFIEIRKETYKYGRDPQLLIDTESHAVESLYLEASKPKVESAA